MKGYLKNPKANEEELFANTNLVPLTRVSTFVSRDEAVEAESRAFVTLKPDVDASDEQRMVEEIMRFSRSKMPRYWVPKSVVFGLLPKTATGKIQKHILRSKAKVGTQ
ncbi:hypothetical protein Leryth_021583 [Lithospermum erythrorhizon]|nr:hypothetical protein Leryth_021583 [Lithospermum erythrorhizon]